MLSAGDLGDVAPAFAAPTLVGVETQTRAKGVLIGSNYQWFNRLIKDDAPYRWTAGMLESVKVVLMFR